MQKIIILDFGSQTTQLIGRRVRELDTFCEILPYNKFPKDDPSVIGVILSGSPFSVHDPEAFKVDLSQFVGRIPVLGICYGAQFISHSGGGKVEKADSREYGRAHLQTVDTSNPLFRGFEPNSQVWMSHGDTITAIPEGYQCIASTADVKYAAYWSADTPLNPSSERTLNTQPSTLNPSSERTLNPQPSTLNPSSERTLNPQPSTLNSSSERTLNTKHSTLNKVWAVQFHPEVFHTVQGSLLLKNFVVDICGSHQDWSAASFVDTTVAELKEQLGDDRVILGLSGGVDSSVAAVLLNKAIGKNLTCIFVDHGMLRKNEFTQVMEDYKVLGLNVIGVDASEKFFADLAGVTDPEQKRKIIGRDFIEVFNAEAKKITDAKWLAQGTIYPDRIESLNITGKVIKSHHNVGGLPKEMHLQLCEPLKWLFKDEVRRVGRQMGMPEHLITRHPFPGPGLAVRILGDITPEKVRILQDADDIYIRSLREYKVKLSGEEARRVLAAGVPTKLLNSSEQTLNPQPSTFNPQPSTLNPDPSTLTPDPSTLNPDPSSLDNSSSRSDNSTFNTQHSTFIEVSLYDQIWQAGAILLSTVRSVGVMGDERTYEHPVALRAVTSTDAMTADWAHLPYDFMAKVSNEIINKVRGVNRVCYDISSKPPSTIEWE